MTEILGFIKLKIQAMNKHKTLSIDEAARMLWSAAIKGIDYLLDSLLPKIAEALNLNYEDYDQDHMRLESLFVSLWATTTALAGEKSELIESIQEFGLRIEGKKQTELKKIFNLRCDDYNEAYDEESGGNQSILCIHILTLMFNRVDDQRDLVNFWSFIQLTNFVLSLIEAIANLRKRLQIED